MEQAVLTADDAPSLREAGTSLLKMLRSVSNFIGTVRGEEIKLDVEKKKYDNFIKNNKFNSKMEKLYNYFSDLPVGLARNTDFLKIFDAEKDDNRNFLKILGAKCVPSDPIYKATDDDERCSVRVLGCLEELGGRKFMDFRVFKEVFGLMPYSYFVRGMDIIMSVGEYNNYADLFRDVLSDLDTFLSRM
jgi:hypothetical protein